MVIVWPENLRGQHCTYYPEVNLQMATSTEGVAARKASLLRTYAFAIVTTLLIWALVTWQGGFEDTVLVVTLTVLEVTFSFDNAIVNSRLLKHLSPFWQLMFMTVGILVAVFIVRFALPVFIVQLTAGLGFTEVINLALHHADVYATELTKAVPVISAFGGTFLVMIGISYFFDEEKDVHWIGWLERRLAPLGRFDNITTFLMVVAGIVMYFTVPDDAAVRASVLVASVAGVALHMGLDLLSSILEPEDKNKVLVGLAAFVMFIRLEVLDASFSFDGVIGAFAITKAVLIIMAGLGAGAMWVRAMTVHLLRAGTLAKYKYLEHGAMWAILFLGFVMIAKLYGVELPEWATGSIGVVFIGIAVGTSVIAQRREQKNPQDEAAEASFSAA